MTSRDRFLSKVRGRLTGGIPANMLRPEPAATSEPIAYAMDLADPVDAFARAAEMVGAEVVVTGGGDPYDIVVALAGDLGASRVAVSADPECAGIAVRLAAAGLDVVDPGNIEAAAGADLGITGAVAGVALTGSLLLASARSGTRLASLLPAVHVALLPADRIVATPGDVLRGWDANRLGELGSNAVFVTGPSRSADIELQLTIGVHGPGRLVIVLV